MNKLTDRLTALRGRGENRYGWYIVRLLVAAYAVLSIVGCLLSNAGLLGSAPVLILAALIPGAVLLVYIYLLDTREKEPASLLAFLLLGGVVALIPAFLIEMVCSFFVDIIWNLLWLPSVLWVCTYCLITSIFVGLAEEGCKLFFLRVLTWRRRSFNYLFDGIVYAVFVSMGFAIVENVEYVFSYGFGTACVRAVVSLPGHMSFAVVMGYFFSKARQAADRNNRQNAGGYLLIALLAPAAIHAAFDTLAMIGSYYTWVNIPVYIFVAVLYSRVFTLVKNASVHDRPIAPAVSVPDEAYEPLTLVDEITLEEAVPAAAPDDGENDNV